MKTPQRIALLIAFTSLLSAAEPLVITKDSVMTFYREYRRLSSDPIHVTPFTSQLCRAPTKADFEEEKKFSGPHANLWVYFYANASAVDAKGAEFPVGAVIVKEKLGEDKKTVTAVGGMVKRAKGYDPANGDWEFFYATVGGEFTTGKLVNCIDCHNGGKRDHVFISWDLLSK